jgi:hypothetical protein
LLEEYAMNEEILRLKREIVAHMYNIQAPVGLPETRRQFEDRIKGLFYSCYRYISDEYYKLSPSMYQKKYGDEGSTIAWLEATKIVHRQILSRAKKVWPPNYD